MDVDKYMTKRIVNNSKTMKDAIDQLIEDGLCVSKSQAKRVYMQVKAVK